MSVHHVYGHAWCPPVEIVESQISPDPTFPTVSFPNSEEKGALDVALKAADEKGVKYVMATDPDADRFICCQKTSEGVGRE